MPPPAEVAAEEAVTTCTFSASCSPGITAEHCREMGNGDPKFCGAVTLLTSMCELRRAVWPPEPMDLDARGFPSEGPGWRAETTWRCTRDGCLTTVSRDRCWPFTRPPLAGPPVPPADAPLATAPLQEQEAELPPPPPEPTGLTRVMRTGSAETPRKGPGPRLLPRSDSGLEESMYGLARRASDSRPRADTGPASVGYRRSISAAGSRASLLVTGADSSVQDASDRVVGAPKEAKLPSGDGVPGLSLLGRRSPEAPLTAMTAGTAAIAIGTVKSGTPGGRTVGVGTAGVGALSAGATTPGHASAPL